MRGYYLSIPWGQFNKSFASVVIVVGSENNGPKGFSWMFSSTSPFSFSNFLREIKGFSYLQVTQGPVKLNDYFMGTLPSFIYQSVPHVMRPCYRVEFRQVFFFLLAKAGHFKIPSHLWHTYYPPPPPQIKWLLIIPIKRSITLNKIPLSKNFFYLHMRISPGGGGGDTPLFSLYGYMLPNRVWFSRSWVFNRVNNFNI